MINEFNIRNSLFVFGIPILLFSVLIWVMTSSFILEVDALSLAVTLDLLIVVPLVYFLLIRTSNIPKTTVVPIMLIGLVLGTYFLPEASQIYLALFKTWALPVMEVSVVTLVVLKVRKALKLYASIQGVSPDFFDTLKSTCTEILPKQVVLPFATEIAVFYYGFIHWKSMPKNENEFTHHQKSGSISLFAAFLMIIVIETVALHLLVARWSIIAAWLLTILSLYTAIQVLGFAKSVIVRRSIITTESVILRYGILSEVEILLSEIADIELSKRELSEDPFTRSFSPLGEMEGHNVILTLNKEREIIGVYGIRKKFIRLALCMDEPEEFELKVNNVLG